MLKQKFWSWGDDFTIKNEAAEDVFFVDGKAFSWGEKLSFQDMSGNERIFIQQKLLPWGPTYEFTQGGELVAVVKEELFTLFNCRCTVDLAGPNDWETCGDSLDHEYSFEPGGHDVLILASAVVIDIICHAATTNDIEQNPVHLRRTTSPTQAGFSALRDETVISRKCHRTDLTALNERARSYWCRVWECW